MARRLACEREWPPNVDGAAPLHGANVRPGEYGGTLIGPARVGSFAELAGDEITHGPESVLFKERFSLFHAVEIAVVESDDYGFVGEGLAPALVRGKVGGKNAPVTLLLADSGAGFRSRPRYPPRRIVAVADLVVHQNRNAVNGPDFLFQSVAPMTLAIIRRNEKTTTFRLQDEGVGLPVTPWFIHGTITTNCLSCNGKSSTRPIIPEFFGC